MHALAGGQDEHGAGAVDHISRGDLLVPRLPEIGLGDFVARADLAVDGKYRADAHVDVDVG